MKNVASCNSLALITTLNPEIYTFLKVPKTPKAPKTPKTPKAPAEKKTAPKAANGKAKNTPKATPKAPKVAKPETITASTTKPQEKKPRISKKKKEEMAKEQVKKIEERKKNLIGEWDDEEDGEIFILIDLKGSKSQSKVEQLSQIWMLSLDAFWVSKG